MLEEIVKQAKAMRTKECQKKEQVSTYIGLKKLERVNFARIEK